MTILCPLEVGPAKLSATWLCGVDEYRSKLPLLTPSMVMLAMPWSAAMRVIQVTAAPEKWNEAVAPLVALDR